jgi:hypothetical protein
MKNLKVLFIDTDIDVTGFKYACKLANIKPEYIDTYDVSEYKFENIDCIVYGYRLYSDKQRMEMLPAYIPRIIWTTTPQYFQDSSDQIIDRLAELETISTIPEHMQIHPSYVLKLINLTNAIRSVCEENTNFIGKYFKDVVEYIDKLNNSNKNHITKVNDNRVIFHKYDETERAIFQQNVDAYKKLGTPIYPDYWMNFYVTVTYYPDNDKIIVKEVYQELLDRHKRNPKYAEECEAGIISDPYIKDRVYYKSTCRKLVITKRGILKCFGNIFKRMPYYSYGNDVLGYNVPGHFHRPGNVFNRILKDINLSYRPDMAWTYMPEMYFALVNQEDSLKVAKMLHKTFRPDLDYNEDSINEYLEEKRKQRDAELQAQYEREVHLWKVQDDLPF